MERRGRRTSSASRLSATLLWIDMARCHCESEALQCCLYRCLEGAAVARQDQRANVVDADLPEAEVQALDQLRNRSSAGVIIASGRHAMRKAVILNDRSPDAAIPALRIDGST